MDNQGINETKGKTNSQQATTSNLQGQYPSFAEKVNKYQGKQGLGPLAFLKLIITRRVASPIDDSAFADEGEELAQDSDNGAEISAEEFERITAEKFPQSSLPELIEQRQITEDPGLSSVSDKEETYIYPLQTKLTARFRECKIDKLNSDTDHNSESSDGTVMDLEEHQEETSEEHAEGMPMEDVRATLERMCPPLLEDLGYDPLGDNLTPEQEAMEAKRCRQAAIEIYGWGILPDYDN
jgi:hypothetical protein